MNNLKFPVYCYMKKKKSFMETKLILLNFEKSAKTLSKLYWMKMGKKKHTNMSTALDSQEWCLIASSTTVAFRLSKISSCSLEVLDFCKIFLNSSCRVSHPIYVFNTRMI